MGSLSTTSAYAAFERMEEKVLALESEAEAVAQLTAPDGVAEKFLALEGGGVDEELAAMKRSMSGIKGELPPGRPVNEALDGEMEALRRSMGRGDNRS